MDILVTVEGQKMKLASNQTHHIEGSSQFVKFVFDLSDEWVGLDTNVQFVQNGEAYGQKLDGSGNKKYAFLPNGITEGECKMVLYGGDGTIRATTNYIPLSIGKDISALRTLSENISRTDYEQALNELKQYVANGGVTEVALNQAFSNAVNEIATEENVKQEIASGITTAKTEIESARVSIETAKTEISNSVSTAKESENKAKKYADAAQEIIDSAETIKNEANAALSNANTAINNANTALSNAVNAVEARNEIIGKGYTYESPAKNSVLQEMRDVKEQVDTFTSDNGALEQAISAAGTATAVRKIVVGETGSASKPDKDSALFKATSIENKIDQANTSATQIEGFRKEITTAHTEVINARNDILSKGTDSKSVYEKIIDAETSVIGAKDLIIGDGTIDEPGKDSILKATKDAQDAAEQFAKEAKEAASSANQGITVINDLNNDSATDALSAQKGKELNVKLAAKVNKVDGKGLSTNDYTTEEKTKLFYIDENANNYTHPDSHEAAMITEDENHKFVSDTEKRIWNNKADSGHDHDSNYLKLSGGTLTGDLILNGDPTSDNVAANKKYVDDAIALAIGTELGGIY